MNYAIKYPTRVSVTSAPDLMSKDIWLEFGTGDGDRMTIILTELQVQELLSGALSRKNAVENARDLYVSGAVELDVFEKELDRGQS